MNALAFHFEKNGEKSDLDRVGLVHRIDKDTSGLLVIAKNEYALSFWQNNSLTEPPKGCIGLLYGEICRMKKVPSEAISEGHPKTECRCLFMKMAARETRGDPL